jgi:hemoglobin
LLEKDLTMTARTLVSAATAMALAAALLTGCATAPEPSLYTRLGGKPAIDAVVSEMIDRTAADPGTKRSFEGVKLAPVKASIADQVCQATGGPCVYKGDSMKLVHKGMGVSTAEFNGLVGHLVAVLNKYKVPAREQKELLDALGPMAPDIIEKP